MLFGDKRTAAILPLNYTPPRVEHSVHYFHKDWDDLIDLLEFPVEHIRCMKRRWKTELDWKLLGPISAHLECGYRNWSTVINLCNYFLKDSSTTSQFQSSMAPEVFVETADGVRLADPSTMQMKNLMALFEKLIAHLSSGGYIVEFALLTHTLTIQYFPPLSKVESWRFNVDCLEPATLAGCPVAPRLHFDIGQDSRERANFVVDYILNPEPIVECLNYSKIRTVPVKLIEEGSDLLEIPAPKPEKPKKPFKALRLGTGSANILELLTYPTIVVEGLSGPGSDSCCVCCDVSIGEVDHYYYMDSVLVKCYTCP